MEVYLFTISLFKCKGKDFLKFLIIFICFLNLLKNNPALENLALLIRFALKVVDGCLTFKTI